jgi:tRNA A-37 threonylcarbamoyl transferase component Bud32
MPATAAEAGRRTSLPIRWTWWSAPDESLQALARQLEAGQVPDDACLIKRGDRRAVWALPEVGGGVLLKQFRVRGWEPWLFLVRRSRAEAEYREAVELRSMGLETPPALGFGERRSNGLLREAWCLTRLVPDASTVGDALRRAVESGDDAAVGRLGAVAMRATAALHRLPVVHRDLHANNMLVGPDGEALVIDLHSVRRVGRLTLGMRVASLARLVFSMRAAVDLRRTESLLAEYARHTGDRLEALAVELAQALDRFERSYVEGRTGRCLVNSKLFVAEHLPEGRVYRRRDYPLERLRADLDRHARIVRSGGSQLLGSTARARVTRVDDEAGARVVKQYLRAGRLPRLRHWLRRGRARTAWIGSRRLDVLGVPTPQALGLLERSDGSAVVFTRLVEGTPLRAWLELLDRDPRPIERRQVAAAVGHVAGRLARAGLLHDDLSTKNLLLTDESPPIPRDRRDAGAPSRPGVRLIDLDNLRPVSPHDPRAIGRMLTQLCDVPATVSRTDRLRFVRAYERAAGRPLPADVADAALEGSRRRSARRAEQPRRTTAGVAPAAPPPLGERPR